MKHVYETNRIAHLWFYQNPSNARNKQNNFFYNYRTIYSYGSHYCCAALVDSPDGRAVFLTNRRYSVTTSGHLSMVRRAIPSETPIFHFDYPESFVLGGKPNHKMVLADYRARIARASERLANRGRKRVAPLLDSLNSIVSEANRYCETFRLKTRFAAVDLDGAQAIAEREREREARRLAKRKKADEDRRRALQAEQAEQLSDWLRGESVRFPFSYDRVYVRLKPGEQDTVETSLGAEFPLTHARVILRMVRSGVPYVHNGHTLHAGVFKVDSIDESGNVRAGCHYVSRSEIERFAASIGLTVGSEANNATI